jgi:hypothetical protein
MVNYIKSLPIQNIKGLTFELVFKVNLTYLFMQVLALVYNFKLKILRKKKTRITYRLQNPVELKRQIRTTYLDQQ